jgi:SAM-dependent methyltransferase
VNVSGEVKHPLFARFFDRFCPSLEREIGPFRDELVAGLSGRVLEVGAGNGVNFSHYPGSVKAVVAIEPEPYLRAKAEQAAASVPVPVSVRPGLAGELDLDPGSFDAAVCCLVLCSIPDQSAALQELYSALRPGGELRFLEHVRGDGAKASVQGVMDGSRVWPALAGGCHCSRDTLVSLRAARFEIRKLRSVNVGPGWMFTNPHMLGAAVR